MLIRTPYTALPILKKAVQDGEIFKLEQEQAGIQLSLLLSSWYYHISPCLTILLCQKCSVYFTLRGTPGNPWLRTCESQHLDGCVTFWSTCVRSGTSGNLSLSDSKSNKYGTNQCQFNHRLKHKWRDPASLVQTWDASLTIKWQMSLVTKQKQTVWYSEVHVNSKL